DPLRDALAEPIASGAVAWLDPIAGDRAARRYLFEHLRSGPRPHVLHFLGHGGVDASGHPTLPLAHDEDGDEDWIKVETLAVEVEASFVGWAASARRSSPSSTRTGTPRRTRAASTGSTRRGTSKRRWRRSRCGWASSRTTRRRRSGSTGACSR